ncbi:hypothetical protein JCM1841_001008 [Sporobolomyces salmonicolor]
MTPPSSHHSPPSLSALVVLSAAIVALASAAPSTVHAQPSLPSPTPAPTPSTSALSPVLPLAPARLAAPAPASPVHLPLFRRNGHLHNLNKRNPSQQQDAVRAWAVREKGRIADKYGASEARLRKRDQQTELEKRQVVGGVDSVISSRTGFVTAGVGGDTTDSSTSGTSSTATRSSAQTSPTPTEPVGLVKVLNYEADLSYYAPVGIGVPPQYMHCILDTGSADLWIASSACTTTSGCPLSSPLYNSTYSTTRRDMNTTFSVKYGGGSAQGEMFQDYVGFAGYNVSSQAFAEIEDLSGDLIGGEISGLMGLGWQSLAASGATPLWQNLYQASVLPFPGFAVSLTRFNDVANASAIEPGGSVTFGYLNASLYSSEVNYVAMPAGMESYWVVPMEGVAVNGTNVTSWAKPTGDGSDAGGTSTTGNSQLVAIDTGTTLIGGPKAVVSAVYAQVKGAKAATGQYSGYYSYPCDLNVSVALTFGDIAYNMSSADFNLGPFGIDPTTNVSTCLGAFFDLSFGTSSKISWVIGAAFLKNVYSVFRASPPSVGFALLSNGTSPHPFVASNSSDPAHDGNLTAIPGIYGPSGTVSVRTTLVPANTVTTAVEAGMTYGTVKNGAGRRSVQWLGAVAAVVAGAAVALW